MSLCEMCNNEFTPLRSDAKYCSGACRSKASYRRGRTKRAKEKNKFRFSILDDIEKVGKLSKDAERSLHRLLTITGEEGADLALAAVFDSLARVNQVYNEKLKCWQQLS